MPNTIAGIEEALSSLKRHLQGSEYTPGVSARVLKAAFTLQKEWLEKKTRLGARKMKGVKFPGIREKVCSLFGVSSATYSNIMSTYLSESKLYTTGKEECGRTGGNNNKRRRITNLRSTQQLIREFVRCHRQRKEKVTAVQITKYLIEMDVLQCNKDAFGVYERKALKASEQAVRRYLQKLGYKRGRRKGQVVQNPEHVIKRDLFLQTLVQNRQKPPSERLREVYLDESYIHHHYKWRPGEDLYDPFDDADIATIKDRHKGARYCFICAIQGPSVMETGLPCDSGGIVPGSWWDFSPTRKKDHKGDYHKVFNGANFTAWFRDYLLPGLTEPCLIIMDNARYHQVYGPEVPKVWLLKKPELQQYLMSIGVPFDPQETKTMLRAKAKKWIQENKVWETVRLANEAGHQILWTAPGYSDLQPIELVWALIKGNVGRQYDIDTSLQDVHDRLLREVERMDFTSGIRYINSVIEKCFKKSQGIWDDINKQPEDDDDDDAGSELSGKELDFLENESFRSSDSSDDDQSEQNLFEGMPTFSV